MGLFDLFRRRPAPPPESSEGGEAQTDVRTSEQLRDAFIVAFAASGSDPAPLNALLTKHYSRLLAEATGWTTVPESIRGDSAAANNYVNALAWLAEHLKQRGHPALYEKLVGSAEDNPVVAWQQRLDQAQQAAQALRFDEALELLNNALIDYRQLSGPGADYMAALTHGLAGHVCFNTRRPQLARGHYEKALRMCEQTRDSEGVGVYTVRLYETHRYLGEGAEAARYAERAASVLRADGKEDEANWYRKQADVYRAPGGVPLLRVVVRLGDAVHELDDAWMPSDATVEFRFERNRPSLGQCEALLKRGGELGAKGQYFEALAEFRAAAEADPYDPHPKYEEGFTLMNLGQHAEAVPCFEAAERLAPGWFNCRGDRWLAAETAAGRVPHEAFTLLRLQDVGPQVITFEDRLELADGALKVCPEVAALHLFRGRMLEGLGRRSEAAAAFRAGLDAAACEPDVKTRLLLHLATVTEGDDEKKRLLREAASLRETGNLMASSMAQVSLRSME